MGRGGVQGWGALLLPHLPSHALGDAPVWVSSSSPGAPLLAWRSRAGHRLRASGASALHPDLQPGRGRCEPAVNAVVPGWGRDLRGSWEWGKGWGCCKSHPCTGTPPASLTHGCSSPSPGMGGRRCPWALSPLPRGTFPRLEAPVATLLHTGASPDPGQAPCLGRKGGSRAGQDAVLRPTKEAAFPAEHGMASGSPQRDEPRAPAVLSPSPSPSVGQG